MFVDNLTVFYKDKKIFENLAFKINGQRFTVILGRSGIGKTTILKCLAGLDLPYTKVQIAKRHLENSAKTLEELKIAYLAQVDMLVPWFNVWDNIFLGYKLREEKIPEVLKEKAKNLLAKMNLINIEKQLPQALSLGMRQRVALIRIIIEDADFILMDEPFSAIDAITKLELQSLLKDLFRHKMVLFVTHDVLEALRLGNYIYILKNVASDIKIEPVLEIDDDKRDLSDPNFLKWQAYLLSQLEIFR